MIDKHAPEDESNDQPRAGESVGITVEPSVIEHHQMPAERWADGHRDAVKDHGAGVQETLSGPRGASGNASVDDPEIMAKSMRKRSSKAGKASRNDDAKHAGSMPLPGLELTVTENVGGNPSPAVGIIRSAKPNPLPGTSYSQRIENAGGPSKKRSPESFCYTTLLHNPRPRSVKSSQNSGKNERGDIDLALKLK